MRIDTSQHMKLSQQMKLAPRMIQSMEILQMTQQALEARIEEELATNPTLELEDSVDDREEIRRELEQDDRDLSENTREMVVDDTPDANNTEDFERLNNLSESIGDDWESSQYETGESFARRQVSRAAGERDGKLDAMANTATRRASLYEQLMDQWRLVETDPKIYEAGEYLIGHIDADGYLRTEERELLRGAPQGIDKPQIDRAIIKLQQVLEPPGLAARNLQECLLLQMDAAERIDSDADFTTERLLVSDYLPDIEANRLPKISKATGLSVDEINAAKKQLRQFSPHPGRLLADEDPHVITPDAVVEYDEDEDRYVATLSRGRLPALHINSDYAQLAEDKSADKRTRQFIGNQLRNARWLMEAIEQRASTLGRVIAVVLDAQRDFFEQGPSALKPLPMTQVADQLGIHVATVSRAVSEKYLQTPRGIYPLRMFFSQGTETEDGEEMSWTAVQAKLKELIDAEDKSKPLSDDTLAETMKEQGIDIARRTVAKYRKQLGIPSARQRREYA